MQLGVHGDGSVEPCVLVAIRMVGCGIGVRNWGECSEQAGSQGVKSGVRHPRVWLALQLGTVDYTFVDRQVLGRIWKNI